jgi:hypothetical protein
VLSRPTRDRVRMAFGRLRSHPARTTLTALDGSQRTAWRQAFIDREGRGVFPGLRIRSTHWLSVSEASRPRTGDHGKRRNAFGASDTDYWRRAAQNSRCKQRNRRRRARRFRQRSLCSPEGCERFNSARCGLSGCYTLKDQ